MLVHTLEDSTSGLCHTPGTRAGFTTLVGSNPTSSANTNRCSLPRTPVVFVFWGLGAHFRACYSPPRTHEHENRRTGFSRRTAVLGFSCSRVRGGGYKQASPNQSHTAALPHHTYTLEMTNFGVVDKLALVTGSTRGLGRVLAQGLIEAGARVVVHGSDAQRAEAAAAELGACGFMACDVRDAAATEAAVSEVIESFGAPDILVNNAGIQRRNPIEVFEDQDWDDIVGVNLSGCFM